MDNSFGSAKPFKRSVSKEYSPFFVFCTIERHSVPFELAGTLHGSVIDMPNILPGGNASIVFPVSFETNRIAMASSTACCRLSATCKPNAYIVSVNKQTCVRLHLFNNGLLGLASISIPSKALIFHLRAAILLLKTTIALRDKQATVRQPKYPVTMS